MAGKKGCSGGARQNSGGARPGAGRKAQPKKPPVKIDADGKDMLALLQQIALGHIDATTTQVRAAIAAVQYTHSKKGEGSKRADEEALREQMRQGGGFKRRAQPRLAAVDGQALKA